MNEFNYGNHGWVCPKCGRVYSPYTSMCSFCLPLSGTITANGSTSVGINRIRTNTDSVQVCLFEPSVSNPTICHRCGKSAHEHIQRYFTT